LAIRLAYLSLIKKLQARETKKTVKIELSTSSIQKTIGVINAFNSSSHTKSRNRAMTLDSLAQEVICLKFIKIFYLKIFIFYFRRKNKDV
jgi:hypothetical protein